MSDALVEVPGFFWHRSAKPKASGRHFIFLSGIRFSAEGWVSASKASFEPSAVQKTPQVCSVSLKRSSSGARNFPCLNIIISSSAGEELPKGNVTFPATLACLERVFVAVWNSAACIAVPWEEEVFCRANGNETAPLAGGPEGGEVRSWI